MLCNRQCYFSLAVLFSLVLIQFWSNCFRFYSALVHIWVTADCLVVKRRQGSFDPWAVVYFISRLYVEFYVCRQFPLPQQMRLISLTPPLPSRGLCLAVTLPTASSWQHLQLLQQAPIVHRLRLQLVPCLTTTKLCQLHQNIVTVVSWHSTKRKKIPDTKLLAEQLTYDGERCWQLYLAKQWIILYFRHGGIQKRSKNKANHRLNGSSSPVLTVTPLSYGKGQNSTPYEIKTAK